MSNWRHRTATSSAEPTNPNQNGAVIPNALREQAADRRADDEAADDRDAVDAGHPAEQLVRDRPLADDRRRRAPHERVGAEDDHRRRARRPLRS